MNSETVWGIHEWKFTTSSTIGKWPGSNTLIISVNHQVGKKLGQCILHTHTCPYGSMWGPAIVVPLVPFLKKLFVGTTLTKKSLLGSIVPLFNVPLIKVCVREQTYREANMLGKKMQYWWQILRQSHELWKPFSILFEWLPTSWSSKHYIVKKTAGSKANFFHAFSLSHTLIIGIIRNLLASEVIFGPISVKLRISFILMISLRCP